jgi:hypothetical protein
MSMSTVGLNVWKKQEFVQEGRQMQQNPLMKPTDLAWKPYEYTRWTEVFRHFDYPKAAWQRADLDVSAVALSGDAVLVAHAAGFEEPRSWKLPPEQQREARIVYKGWKLSAFERDSGREMWGIALPSEPLPNGICIAADGSIITALRDGTLLCVRAT